jgi:DNA ligase (NAD+)
LIWLSGRNFVTGIFLLCTSPKNNYIQNLKKQTNKIKMAKTTTIAGNTFLFTGKLNEFKREDAEAHVKAEGGKVLSGVSAKLNYLVVGEDAGSKLAKAEALGTVTILHEKEFLKMMHSGS